MKRCDPSDDREDHHRKRYDRPDNAPAMRRTTILLGKDRRIRTVLLAKDKVVALQKLSADCCHISGGEWRTISQTE